MNKKYYIFFCFLVFAFPSDDFFDDIDFSFDSPSDLTWKDSIPSNMPLIKKPFWSENGIFRKTELAPSSRYAELQLRSDMMQWHQKIALINIALMGYQYYLGKEIDQYRAPIVLGLDKYNDYKDRHKSLGYATYTLYMTSAGLSIFSPPSLEYDENLSPMKLHRYLALVHFVGMSVQPWLGYQSVNNPDDYDEYMDLHRKTGEVVFVTYLLSFLLTLFS